MTRTEAITILSESKEAFIDSVNYTFSEAILDAEEQLEKIEKILKKITPVNEKYSEYNSKLNDLLVKYSKKNEDGSPKYHEIDKAGNRSYEIEETSMNTFKREREELYKVYEEDIVDYTKKIIKYGNEAKKDTQYKKVDIDEEFIPKNLPLSSYRIIRTLLNIKK